ncbi:MAG: hypothetical protein M1818_006240 [Claussenomyces sp. TS43310]|nr:MAG: hypothetical protein M1818_006240 [Claussenomyces sp. TS43310]
MRIEVRTSDRADHTHVSPGPAATEQHSRHGIKADLLIPGRGEPLEHGAVVIDQEKLAWVGPQSCIPSIYASIPYVSVPVVMPGLWDCHVHYTGSTLSSNDQLFGTNGALVGARVSRDVANTLLAGFTSVRELGGCGGDVSPAINDGSILGPHIYSSIAPISMTGGHGDIHTTPLLALLDACAHGYPIALCDGEAECIRAVRLQLRRGARVIKVAATGGVGSEMDDPQDRQFSDKELTAMVEEAARAKRIVAAHCHGKEGIIAALKAGCKTIEHGSYLDEEAIELMKDKGAILIATRSIQEGGLQLPEMWSPRQYEKLKVIVGQNKKAYELAVQHGVRIALGTDLGLSDAGTVLSHGRNGKELWYAVQAGLTPLQAIEASTATAPETLGPQAPRSGLLKEGYDADLIAVCADPSRDIGLLSEAENITHVWKAGKLYKSPR